MSSTAERARTEDAVGAIKCPLCNRPAEVHRFAVRSKVSVEGEGGKAAYPAKLFVMCPATSGYSGCGTILANGREAQLRILDHARMKGAGSPRTPTTAQPAPKDKPAAGPDPPPPAKPAQPAAAPARNPFKLFG